VNASGLDFPYNLNELHRPSFLTRQDPFLQQAHILDALHVGNPPVKKFSTTSSSVYDLFKDDIYQTVKPELEVLLNAGYHILLYSGLLLFFPRPRMVSLCRKFHS